MKAGDIVLFNFPLTNLEKSKLRPSLLISKVPGKYDDWLICMISSQMHQLQKDYDFFLSEGSEEFSSTGLKSASVIRSTRLAVVNSEILLGKIGNISSSLLKDIKTKISNWVLEENF